MSGPERFDIGSPARSAECAEDRDFDDGPVIASERRIRSPIRTPARKRKETIQDDEPGTKMIIRDEPSDEEVLGDDNSMDLIARREDKHIVAQAILGRSLHEVYSNTRIKLAIDRQSAEHMMSMASPTLQRGTKPGWSGGEKDDARVIAAPEVGALLTGVIGGSELASADVVEVFSPERVGEMCKKFGLEQGAAMDLKNGYDFDLAKDRARCWEEIEKSAPLLVIGSPPCTLFSQLQEINKHMYRDNKLWMEKFQQKLQQAKRYIKFCTAIRVPEKQGEVLPP